jgi:hypothetical protein
MHPYVQRGTTTENASSNEFPFHPSELHRLIPTLRTNPLPVLVEQPGNRQHGHRDEAEQTRCPTHSEALIHLECEQREHRTERVPGHAVRRHRRSAVERPIRVDEVESGAKEDAQIAPSERNAGKYGGDPVDVAAGTPAEPEQTIKTYVSSQKSECLTDVYDNLPNWHTEASHLSAQ